MAFENYDRNRLFELIYTGLVGVHNLPKDLFRQTFDNLFDGMNAGLGIQYNYNDPILIRELTENIYLFSGAKTAVQLMDMKGAMIGADGKLLSFSQFKKIADEKFNLYNVDYLKTEYNTAVGQGQMVSKWTEFVENTEQFPMLQYDAVMDGRTSPICRPLDGIILPVDDPFWKQYSPLNHFNCRCQLIRLSVYDDPKKTTPKKLKKASETAKETVSDVFKMNPFYDKVIFSKKHPYFEAVANIPGFKLPIIEKPIVPKQPKPTPTAESLKYNVLPEFDVPLDKQFTDLIKEKINVRLSVRDEGSFALGNNVVLDNKRYITEFGKKKIQYHEYGHVIHDQHKWISHFRNANPIVEQSFKNCQKTFKKFEPLQKAKFHSDSIKYQQFKNEIKLKFTHLNNNDFDEMWSSTMDTIQSLTNSQFGWGHAVSYYNRGMYFRHAEFIAHAFENKYITNEIFKHVLPEIYDEMVLMIEKLINL